MPTALLVTTTSRPHACCPDVPCRPTESCNEEACRCERLLECDQGKYLACPTGTDCIEGVCRKSGGRERERETKKTRRDF